MQGESPSTCPQGEQHSEGFVLFEVSFSPPETRNVGLTSKDTTIPTDLGLPITTSLVLSTQLVQLVLQAERQDLLEIVVWSLSFLGVGESSNGNTVDDGLAIGSLREDESSWSVTDCRDRLLGVVELTSAHVAMIRRMAYLLDELGEFLVESQIYHRSVLNISQRLQKS